MVSEVAYPEYVYNELLYFMIPTQYYDKKQVYQERLLELVYWTVLSNKRILTAPTFCRPSPFFRIKLHVTVPARNTTGCIQF